MIVISTAREQLIFLDVRLHFECDKCALLLFHSLFFRILAARPIYVSRQELRYGAHKIAWIRLSMCVVCARNMYYYSKQNVSILNVIFEIFVCFMHAKHIWETALPALIKWCVMFFFSPSRLTASMACSAHAKSAYPHSNVWIISVVFFFICSCFRRIYWYAIHDSLLDFK